MPGPGGAGGEEGGGGGGTGGRAAAGAVKAAAEAGEAVRLAKLAGAVALPAVREAALAPGGSCWAPPPAGALGAKAVLPLPSCAASCAAVMLPALLDEKAGGAAAGGWPGEGGLEAAPGTGAAAPATPEPLALGSIRAPPWLENRPEAGGAPSPAWTDTVEPGAPGAPGAVAAAAAAPVLVSPPLPLPLPLPPPPPVVRL